MDKKASSTQKNDHPIHYQTVIIGAGMAGLSAAYTFVKNGCTNFKILEGRGRIGGRIVQLECAQTKVELGANWIHGVLGNPVYELAMHYGLVDILQMPKTHKVVAATENGKQVAFSVLQEIYEAYMCFLKRCEEYYLSHYLPPDGIDSVGQHIRLEIDLYLQKFDQHEKNIRQLLFECLLKRETCISGCDSMDQVDLLELGSYTELQGGNITLPEGYSSILGPLSNEIPKENILLHHPVVKIEYDTKCNDSDTDSSDATIVEVNSENFRDKGKVRVLCENGEVFSADCAICTVPLGVLKLSHSELFQPPLPDYKIQAIEKLLFGTVDKILLEYERPFLNPGISEVLLLWESVKGGDDNEDLSAIWYKKIYSFTKISDTLMMGWISGRAAEYMETLSETEINERCTNALRMFLKDPFIPKAKKVVCTSWFSQKYTRGSYTAIGVGSSQIDIEYLAQPIYDENDEKPIVLFAGEHAHSSFYSTVHGAFLSGRNAAQTVIKFAMDSDDQEVVLNGENHTDLSEWIQNVCLH